MIVPPEVRRYSRRRAGLSRPVAWPHRAERDLDRPSPRAAYHHPELGRADHGTVSASAEVSREFVGRLADTDWPAAGRQKDSAVNLAWALKGLATSLRSSRINFGSPAWDRRAKWSGASAMANRFLGPSLWLGVAGRAQWYLEGGDFRAAGRGGWPDRRGLGRGESGGPRVGGQEPADDRLHGGAAADGAVGHGPPGQAVRQAGGPWLRPGATRRRARGRRPGRARVMQRCRRDGRHGACPRRPRGPGPNPGPARGGGRGLSRAASAARRGPR
jgi:hypothetical protein